MKWLAHDVLPGSGRLLRVAHGAMVLRRAGGVKIAARAKSAGFLLTSNHSPDSIGDGRFFDPYAVGVGVERREALPYEPMRFFAVCGRADDDLL